MDTYSEAWRHECEVRTVLAMPVDRRKGFLEVVAKRRGLEAARVLQAAVYRTWIARQVDGLLSMTPAARGARLAKIESSSNKRTREDVEAALERRIAANDNLKEDHAIG
jgi:ClpP class serine protease